MTSPEFDPHDEWLMQELKAATADLPSIPPTALQAAKATFTWRLIDEELETLTLCFDSAVDEVALVRGPTAEAPRSLSFELGDHGLEIELHAGQLTGQILPPQPGQVLLRTVDRVFAQTAADATGCFVLDRPLTGPQRLEVDLGGPVLATEWVLF